MERLTSNKSVSEMEMVELAYNSCFIKDRAGWYRDYSVEVDARTLARNLLKDFADGDDAFTCDEDFEEYITACLEDGMDSIEGLIALFYRNLWAMAGLREHLKFYEDLEEQGKLLRLPVAVGDTVYTLNPLMNGKTAIGETTADAFFCALVMLEGRFGKTVFLTREEAEAALKGAEQQND